jgi:hypothetical protein
MWQQKVFTKLLGLQYHILYKPRTDNRVADALSHRGQLEELSAISTSIPSWLDEVKLSYDSDPKATELLAKLAISSKDEPNYALHQGLICYKGCIWVGANSTLQTKIIQAFHLSAVGGHSGFPVTYGRVKQLFAWSELKTAVHQFVSQCPTCQQAKPDRAKYLGLLQPLPIPSMA